MHRGELEIKPCGHVTVAATVALPHLVRISTQLPPACASGTGTYRGRRFCMPFFGCCYVQNCSPSAASSGKYGASRYSQSHVSALRDL